MIIIDIVRRCLCSTYERNLLYKTEKRDSGEGAIVYSCYNLSEIRNSCFTDMPHQPLNSQFKHLEQAWKLFFSQKEHKCNCERINGITCHFSIIKNLIAEVQLYRH